MSTRDGWLTPELTEAGLVTLDLELAEARTCGLLLALDHKREREETMLVP